MVTNLVLSFRESFEAVLVIGIIFSYISKSPKNELKIYVIYGAIIGMIVSFIGGALIFSSVKGLEESGMEIFEGIMMLISAGLIAYFVIWMSNQNRHIGASIKASVDKKLTGIGIFTLAFFAVFREGLELVIFTLTKVSENASTLIVSTLAGLFLAIAVGLLIFKSSINLNLKWIFNVLGIILIYIGAELFSEGMIKFFPKGGEMMKVAVMLTYAFIGLYVFIKDDVRKLLSKNSHL